MRGFKKFFREFGDDDMLDSAYGDIPEYDGRWLAFPTAKGGIETISLIGKNVPSHDDIWKKVRERAHPSIRDTRQGDYRFLTGVFMVSSNGKRMIQVNDYTPMCRSLAPEAVKQLLAKGAITPDSGVHFMAVFDGENYFDAEEVSRGVLPAASVPAKSSDEVGIARDLSQRNMLAGKGNDVDQEEVEKRLDDLRRFRQGQQIDNMTRGTAGHIGTPLPPQVGAWDLMKAWWNGIRGRA